jgi:hypothetical protein
MPQVLTGNAYFKRPNIIILDNPIELDFTRANVIIEPFENNNNKHRILGLFEGQIEISDDFDEPLEEFKEYME